MNCRILCTGVLCSLIIGQLAYAVNENLWKQFVDNTKLSKSEAWRWFELLDERDKLKCSIEMVAATAGSDEISVYQTLAKMLGYVAQDKTYSIQHIAELLSSPNTLSKWKEYVLLINVEDRNVLGDNDAVIRDVAMSFLTPETPLDLKRSAVRCVGRVTAERILEELKACAKELPTDKSDTSLETAARQQRESPSLQRLIRELDRMKSFAEKIPIFAESDIADTQQVAAEISRIVGNCNLIQADKITGQLERIVADADMPKQRRIIAALCCESVSKGKLDKERLQWLKVELNTPRGQVQWADLERRRLTWQELVAQSTQPAAKVAPPFADTRPRSSSTQP